MNIVKHIKRDAYPSTCLFSPKGKYFVAVFNNVVEICDSENYDTIHAITHSDIITSCSFSRDDKYIVTGTNDGQLNIINTLTGQDIHTIYNDVDMTTIRDRNWPSWRIKLPRRERIYTCSFSHDSKHIVSTSQNIIRIWDVQTGEKIQQIDNIGSIISCAYSSNGHYIVSGAIDNVARIWDSATGKEIYSMVHDGLVASCSFSPDDRYIVTGSHDGTVRLWDATTMEEIHRLNHNYLVSSCAISPDGRYIVSGAHDNIIRVWNMKTGKELYRIENDNTIISCSFSSDCKRILIGDVNLDDVEDNMIHGSIKVIKIPTMITSLQILASNEARKIITEPINLTKHLNIQQEDSYVLKSLEPPLYL